LTDDPYVVTGTGVLINLLGLSNPDELTQVRRRPARVHQLHQRRIDGTYEVAHLKSFHRFCDCQGSGSLIARAVKPRAIIVEPKNLNEVGLAAATGGSVASGCLRLSYRREAGRPEMDGVEPCAGWWPLIASD
jgi:hypothetical protein